MKLFFTQWDFSEVLFRVIYAFCGAANVNIEGIKAADHYSTVCAKQTADTDATCFNLQNFQLKWSFSQRLIRWKQSYFFRFKWQDAIFHPAGLALQYWGIWLWRAERGDRNYVFWAVMSLEMTMFHVTHFWYFLLIFPQGNNFSAFDPEPSLY